MGLLIINYFLAAFLFIFAYYADALNIDRVKKVVSFFLCGAFIVFIGGATSQFLYSGGKQMGLLCARLLLIAGAILSYFLMRIALYYPYGRKKKAKGLLFALYIIAAAVFAFTMLRDADYYEVVGFYFVRPSMEIMGFNLFDCVAAFLYVVLPVLSVLILFIRSLTLRSRIYRSQLRALSFSTLAGLLIIGSLFYASTTDWTLYWLAPLSLGGIVVASLLMYQSIGISSVPDKKNLASKIATVVIATFLLSFVCAVVITFFDRSSALSKHRWLLFIVNAVVLFIALYARRSLEARLKKGLRVESDYRPELEKIMSDMNFDRSSDEIMKETADALKNHAGCQSVDFVVENDKGELAVRYSTDGHTGTVELSNKLVDFLLSRNITVLFKNHLVTQRVYSEFKGELLDFFDKFSAEAVLIMQDSRHIIGMTLLGAKRMGNDYTDYDYDTLYALHPSFFVIIYYLKNIANESVVLIVDRELEYSGQIIQSIQNNIDRMDHEKIDIDYVSQSARKLGGDFVDFIRLSPDRYMFVMGDVSGKGLNASMSMVILKSVIRTLLLETSDFKELVVKINKFVKVNLPRGIFFAGIFGLFDLSSNALYYINCGIPMMLLYTTAYNNAVEIQGEGRVLGFVRDISPYLKVKKITLHPDDILLLTTDGLIDSVSLRNERFGKDRVQRYLMNNKHYSADRITRFLIDEILSFTSKELNDDVTVLAAKYMTK